MKIRTLAYSEEIDREIWDMLKMDEDVIEIKDITDDFLFTYDETYNYICNKYSLSKNNIYPSLENFLIHFLQEDYIDELAEDEEYVILLTYKYDINEKLKDFIESALNEVYEYRKEDTFGSNFLNSVKMSLLPFILEFASELLLLKARSFEEFADKWRKEDQKVYKLVTYNS